MSSRTFSWQPTIDAAYRSEHVWAHDQVVRFAVSLFRKERHTAGAGAGGGSAAFDDKNWSFQLEEVTCFQFYICVE